VGMCPLRETFQREILKSRHYISSSRAARVCLSRGDELVYAAPAVAAAADHGGIGARPHDRLVFGVSRLAHVQTATAG